MESFYLTVVVILFALAISDLIVGVSNDAVNFLNSAVGSKAAPKWAIFLVASFGVFIGATFSSGMMEVARKGIFNPDMFVFSEIMIIFLAVMITDVILLDLFNTFGMPTSTTVSIVFELLGSAVAVATVKLGKLSSEVIPDSLSYELTRILEVSGLSDRAQLSIGHFINSDKALAIIAGILLSVVVAFSVGAIIQWFTRVVFTFHYEKKSKLISSIFGGLSMAAITYFIVIKGAKGASWIDKETVTYIKEHTLLILGVSFLVCSLLLQVISTIFKQFNTFRLIVMLGTFSLAMAFAGNDLVNFIGVPLAGFDSYKAWLASGGTAPDALAMGMLNEKAKAETYMLLIAGLIMIVTLITSKKAKRVIATSINLSKQGEADERFGASVASRAIVRSSINFSNRMNRFSSQGMKDAIETRFEPASVGDNDDDAPAFDMVRASVNLVVAAILISIGTSLKLPLSTTYVTFMVAMGTSLADKAWDRESAVYRVSGVFNVIGGWFLTAFVAFTAAFIVAFVIVKSGNFMVYIFCAIALVTVLRSHLKKKDDNDVFTDEDDFPEAVVATEKVLEKSKQRVNLAIECASKSYDVSIGLFELQNRKGFKGLISDLNNLKIKSKKWKTNLNKVVLKLQKNSIETGHYYVQIIDYVRELSKSLDAIVIPLNEHMENNHKSFTEVQFEEMSDVRNDALQFFEKTLAIVQDETFDQFDDLVEQRDLILKKLDGYEKTQIRRIKNKEVNTRNSVLYFNTLSESKNMLTHSVNICKAYRDFVLFSKESIS